MTHLPCFSCSVGFSSITPKYKKRLDHAILTKFQSPPLRAHLSLRGTFGLCCDVLSVPPTARALCALPDVQIGLLPQVWRQGSESESASWFIDEPLQPFLQKPLDPLVGMATTQVNRGGSVGDGHP